MEQKAQQGPTREQPGPLPTTLPSMMGGWRGWIWPGDPIRVGAQCGLVIPGAGGQVWGGWRRPFSHRSPSRRVWEIGRVEGTSCGYPKLVAEAGDNSRCAWCPGACPKDTGLFQAAPTDEWGTWHWELLSGPTGTPLSLPKIFPLTARSKVPLPGPLGGATKEDHSLCTGSTMLGQKGQSTYTRLTMPFGGVHPGTM